MPVKELRKKTNHAAKISEKKVEKFISRGGTLANATGQAEDEHRLTLRFPKSLVARIDRKRKEKLGSISRNLWIIQALDRASK